MLFPKHRGIPKYILKGQPYELVANSRHQIVVPDGKIWEILEVGCFIVDSGTLSIFLHTTEDVNHGYIVYSSATTGPVVGPVTGTGANYLNAPVIAWENEKIRFQFGTAQTTGGDHLWIKYIEYDIEELLKKK